MGRSNLWPRQAIYLRELSAGWVAFGEWEQELDVDAER
jgi:hypothetical protein